MNGSIYMLSRRVDGDNGEKMMQNVTVFATSPDEARAVVNDQFARLRRISHSPERAYQPTPAFEVEKIALDRPKLIATGITL
jgi:hypothetical protein